jgi:hypothetical protein
MLERAGERHTSQRYALTKSARPDVIESARQCQGRQPIAHGKREHVDGSDEVRQRHLAQASALGKRVPGRKTRCVVLAGLEVLDQRGERTCERAVAGCMHGCRHEQATLKYTMRVAGILKT